MCVCACVCVCVRVLIVRVRISFHSPLTRTASPRHRTASCSAAALNGFHSCFKNHLWQMVHSYLHYHDWNEPVSVPLGVYTCMSASVYVRVSLMHIYMMYDMYRASSMDLLLTSSMSLDYA